MTLSDRKIVAVSNGMGSIGLGLGSYVDLFDEIVRFNTAEVTSAFQSHVGKKTTIWARSDMMDEPNFTGYEHAYRKFAHCRQLLAVPDLPSKQDVKPKKNVEMIPLDLERELRREVAPKGGRWITTGVITLAWLLREFQTIHVLGWFPEEHAFESHYFTKARAAECLGHDIAAEKLWFKQKLRQGRLVELTDKVCDALWNEKTRGELYPGIRKMWAQHPCWQGDLYFYPSRRVVRPGIDAGHYSIGDDRKMTLDWDNWSAEVLDWDVEKKLWVGARGFKLKEVLE